jgi:anti-sigma B factor antagonist
VPFDVRPTAVRGHPVLVVQGELDLLTAPALADAVRAALADRPPLLALDLTATTFLDSSGAREIAIAARGAGAAGTELVLVCPSGNRPVRLVLDLLDLKALLPVLESAELIGPDPRP